MPTRKHVEDRLRRVLKREGFQLKVVHSRVCGNLGAAIVDHQTGHTIGAFDSLEVAARAFHVLRANESIEERL